MNLATLLEGPANVTHLGQTLHFRGGLTLTPLADLFEIMTDVHGVIDQRALDNSFVLSGTPVGVWSAAQIAALWRTANLAPGRLVTPRYDVLSVTHASDTIALVGSAMPRAGCPVRIIPFPGSTLPAGYDAATTYYWGTSGKLYGTEANALTDNGTGVSAITGDGTGDFALIEQETTVIEAITANRRITLHNTAIITPPPVILSATATLLGQVVIGAFRKEGAAWLDANSVYTVAKAALSDTPPAASDIPTQEYACTFGAAPWDAFKARGPITITPTLNVEPVTTDGRGLLGMKVAGRGITASLQPVGFSEAQMLDLLGVQGGTVARGKTRVRGDLVVSGTGVHCTLYNGAPRQLPQTFQTTGPRAGELEIVGHQNSGGELFRFGTAAPE